MSALIFFIVLSILVLVHEFGHFITSKLSGVKVEEFGLGLPPRLFGIRLGETLYSINILPFGGFVKVFGEDEEELKHMNLSPAEKARSFSHKHPLQKILILTAGVICNFLLGWGIMTYLFTQGVVVPTDKVTVDVVAKNSPADMAHIKKNDIITSAAYKGEKKEIRDTAELITFSKSHAGTEITLGIKRAGKDLTVQMTPRANPPRGEGSLGMTISNYEMKKYSLGQAPFLGLKESATMTIGILHGLSDLAQKAFTFQTKQLDVVGPVGIYMITADKAKEGLNPLLQMMGLLSLNLAVINILPFPALDGGRLAMVLYESIARRKVQAAFQYKLNSIGFAILIGLIVLITLRDLTHMDQLRMILNK